MAAMRTTAAIHTPRRKSQEISDVAPYHSSTSHSAAAPATRQVGLNVARLVLPQGRDRERGDELADRVGRLAPAPHAETVREDRHREQLDVVGQDEVAALEQRPRLSCALQVDARDRKSTSELQSRSDLVCRLLLDK